MKRLAKCPDCARGNVLQGPFHDQACSRFASPAAEPAPVGDPWAHRSAGMRCRSCMWFAPKAGAVKEFGRCRRHAPTMNGFPAVFGVDWCGDHKLDEAKA